MINKIILITSILALSCNVFAGELSEIEKSQIASLRCEHKVSVGAGVAGGATSGASVGALGCFAGALGCVVGVGLGALFGGGSGAGIQSDRRSDCYEKELKKLNRGEK